MKPTTYHNPDQRPVPPYPFPLGITETFSLLDEVVAHWKAVRNNPLFEPCGGGSCAFCVEFQATPGNCTTCPIASFGYKGCTGSPFDKFAEHRHTCRVLIKQKSFTPIHMKLLIRFANQELRFLDSHLREYLAWSSLKLKKPKKPKRPDLKPGDIIQVWQDHNRKSRYLRRFSHWSNESEKVWCYNDGDYPGSPIPSTIVPWNHYSLPNEEEMP